MLSTAEMIDRAKSLAGDVSDYRLAKLLGVPPSTVCNYQKGRSMPANPIAMRLGALAGLDPLAAVAAVNFERSTTEEDRELWQAMLKRLAATARQKSAS